jgi:hypothetical protein
MKSNKTPGSGGFSSEFYLYFWKELKYTMVNSFKESLENVKLTDSQRLGVITCLHQRNGILHDVYSMLASALPKPD